MPPRKRVSSVLNSDSSDHPDGSPRNVVHRSASGDAQALAEEAEADALAAEAAAEAARARARAVKLRRQASESAAAAAEHDERTDAEDTPVEDAPDAETIPVEDAPNVDTTVVETTSETGATDEAPVRLRRPQLKAPRVRLRWVAAALVVLCALGFTGAGGYVVWHHRQAVAEQQRTAEFAAAARQGVVTLMSLNFNNAEDDVKRILDNTTGDFKKDFEGQADEFANVAKQSKVVTDATVTATAVQSMAKDAATVLVAVTTQVSNAASKDQQPRSWRLRVDLARDGGQLKLAKVEFVP